MTPPRTVLIVDDEPLKTLTLEEHLAQAGFEVLTAVNGAEALALLKTRSVDAVVSDIRMPGLDGFALLEESMKLDPRRPVLIMTGYGEVQDAVRAMKAGALDYMVKPVSGEEIVLRLNRVLAGTALADENLSLRQEVQKLKGPVEPVIVGSGMDTVRQVLDKAAVTDATVLLVGETGTGKEICARYLHQHSARKTGPFVGVPCAALPASLIESELFGHEKGAFTGASMRRNGYFATADGGTIFLDDVDDLPLDIQGRLLYVLQSRTFQRVGSTHLEKTDVRVVAATKKNLQALVQEKRFRDDLMYRLSVVTVSIPPLRDRQDNIPLLADFFLRCVLSRLGRSPRRLSEDALRALSAYSWPGNVRELEHAIESAVIMHTGTWIEPSDLPPTIYAPPHSSFFSLYTEGKKSIPLEQVALDLERALLRWAFQKAAGNQGEAAKLLEIPRSTFQYRWAKAFKEPGNGTETNPEDSKS